MNPFQRGRRAAVLSLLASTALAGAAAAQADPTAPTAANSPDDEIVVTASPLEGTLTETARPVSIVDRDEVLRKGAASLGELLGDLPGVAESSFARGASRPIIRGLDNARVRVQENGLGSADVSAVSEDHGVPIDPLAAQRVEIIRGPGVLRYGSEAIGGVVSVLNNRIPERAPEGGFGGEIFADAASVDNGTSFGGLADIGGNGLALHADGFYRDTGDYATPRGDQLDTYSQTYGFAGGGSVLWPRGFLGASAAVFDSEYGIPAAEERLFIDLDQVKYTLSGGVTDLEGFVSKLSAKGVYTDYTHDEVEAETGDIGSTFENTQWEMRLEAVHRRVGGVEGAFGLQARNRDLEATGEGGELIAPSDTSAYAAFLFEEIALSQRATLEAALRVEHVEVDGTGFSASDFDGSLPATTTTLGDVSRGFTLPSVSVGLRYAASPSSSIGLSAQYVQRAPDALELFAKGPHEATETFEIGDWTLDEESAISVEATFKQAGPRGEIELAAYYAQFDNFIFKSETGLVCGEEFDTCGVAGAPGVEEELTQIVYAQSDADFWGFEASANLDLLPAGAGWIGADGRFDYVRAEFSDGGNVPRIPPARAGIGLYFSSPAWFVRAGVLRVTEQDETALNEPQTKGYTDLRASVVRTFEVSGAGQFDIGLSGSNLLDADARNHTSFKKEEVLLPGRSGRLFLRAQF